MTVDELIEAAQEHTGLSSFDSESFREGLGVLLQGFLARSDLGPGSLGALRENAVSALSNRLRVAEHVRQDPGVLEQPVEAPLVIMGMPRTGTTAISYLLDLDPRWRSLLNWEAVDSAPPATPDTWRTDPRCVTRRELQQKIFDALPSAPVHWEWADGPTECIFVLAQDFKALALESLFPSRGYAEYILSCDMTSAYAYHRLVLQVLQSGVPGRWSLKMPSHSLHIEALTATYPDARMIWTHRDPFRTLASLCATISSGHMAGLGHVDLDHLRRTYPHQLAEHVRRPMALRPKLPDDVILDVYAADFFADPLREMQRIYEWLELELPASLEAEMRAWMRRDAERQARRAPYRLEDYGLTRADVAHHFEAYLAAYPRAAEA